MHCLPNIGEVINYEPQEGLFTLAYIVNKINNLYILYSQNRLIAIEVQHTIEEDANTGDLTDVYHEICTTEICDYCILPEADYILKQD